MQERGSNGIPWLRRLKRGLLKFWRVENPKGAVLRDVVVAGAAVLFLLTVAWVYTGQSFPGGTPIVVVESGSLMHGPYRSGNIGDPTGWSMPPFGRVGTIDPGDLVFLRDIDAPSDIEVAFGTDGRGGYGGHGDVIVFNSFNGLGNQIIHRAMLYVEAVPEGCTPRVDCTFRIPEACDPGFLAFVVSGDFAKYCEGSADTLSGRLERDGLKLQLGGYPCSSGSCPPFRSSFITMGDNNGVSDQNAENGACYVMSTGCNSSPIEIGSIVGKARGELPWVGMIKLMIYGNPRYVPSTDPTLGDNWQILRATAPWDIWLCLFIVIGLVIAFPIGFDFAMDQIRTRRDNSRPPTGPAQEKRNPATEEPEKPFT